MEISKVKKDFRKKREIGVYMNTLLSRKIQVSFNKIGKNIKEVLEKSVKRDIEGKCTKMAKKTVFLLHMNVVHDILYFITPYSIQRHQVPWPGIDICF